MLDMATLSRLTDPDDDDGTDIDVFTVVPGTDLVALARPFAELQPGSSPEQLAREAAGTRPDEFTRLDEVHALPWLLAAFLGLIAVTATMALLVTAVRRRRHDFAVLRTEGLDGAGLRAIVVAQAVTVSLLGLLIGVPTGLVIGRQVWRLVAESMGVRVLHTIPIAAIAGTMAAVVLVDLAISLWPARQASRVRPAVVLRAE